MQVDPQDAVVHAIPARPLPLAAAAARLAGLDIEARFRTIAVPFPSMLEVGTCFTQVTKRDRPVPFTLDRIAFEAPQAAIDEADGATIVLEYRFLARSGRIIEAARCRVPKSQLAIDQVFGQFTEHGLGARRGTLKAALAKGTSGLANGWVVSVDPGSFLPGGVVATMSGDGLCGTEENPCILDGVETEQCDSGWQEWNEDLNECYCANGSDEWDCWLDPNPGGPGPGGPTPPGGGAGGGDPVADLEALLSLNQFALLDSIPCALLPEMSGLAQTTVPQWIIDRKTGTALQELATAAGKAVNVDKYTVMLNMNAVPSGISAEGVFEHIRTNLPALTAGNGTFSYYDAEEQGPWLSSQPPPNGPQGTYFSIDLPWPLSASVVASDFIPDASWTFSTVSTSQDLSHPVSGHRSFTWTEAGGWGVLTIRGVDRVSTPLWNIGSTLRDVFDAGDLVWQNFQMNLSAMWGGAPSRVGRHIVWTGSSCRMSYRATRTLSPSRDASRDRRTPWPES